MKEPNKCRYCGKDCPGKRRLYCSDICQYRIVQIKKDNPRKFSVAQHLRMARAERSQRKGRVGVRFN